MASRLDALIDELQAVETRTGNQESLARARVLKGLALVCQTCFSSARGIHDTESFREHVRRLPPGTSIKECFNIAPYARAGRARRVSYR